MLSERQLDAALATMDHLERIEIEVIDGGFRFRMLGDGGRQIVAGEAGPEQIAPMLQVAEILLNTELGVRDAQLCQPAFN